MGRREYCGEERILQERENIVGKICFSPVRGLVRNPVQLLNTQSFRWVHGQTLPPQSDIFTLLSTSPELAI